MHDLSAQVTSSLLPFPGVTINALGEDEITLDYVLQGKFTVGRSGLAWLACGPHLEAVHAVTGERLSAYTFSGGGEHPPCILAAKDFGWLKRSGLLIGLEEVEGSVLCLYDLGLSRVVKAVVIPGRITAIEPIVSYGGASTSTQHLHQSLRWFFGIAAVGTDLGHVLLVDLCLDDLACSQSELEASDLQVVTKSPAEIPKLREVSSREGRHLCLQLNGATGVGATALQYISRTNQLAVGFADGYLHLWNMKSLKKEYHSQLEGGKVPVNAFTFQEPENDPRNCCYLWAVQSSQDLEGDMVSLRLLQLAFSERKCAASGKILYEGLEYCEERYSQELSGTAFPLRAQATNTRLLCCHTIEKFRPHLDRDDSMNEAASPDTSVSIFSWQVRAYGQGTPATYIGVFDINRWYHAQMPDSLRAGESLQNCPYLAVWSLDAVMQMVSPHALLDVVVHDRSLSRGLPYTCPPPEQYFNPTTYNFDASCLLDTGVVHLTCSGYQKETLGFLKKAAPCSSDVISASYSRCLMSGLLSHRLADAQASSLTQEEQLDAILCTAVETSSLGLITGCIKQWTAEEQPGSALNLRYILDWAWDKVVQTKEELDNICAPLFDSSSNFTDPQTMQLLQHSQRLLTNLSTIFHCLLNEAQELTQKGLLGLMNKNVVSSLISKYAQVVLWFCRTGLLPEGSDEDALQISRPFYSHSVISNYYTIRREELSRLAKGKWCADCLMIDGLVGQGGDRLLNLWRRDEGGTGQYPPPTLHALLDIYLLDNIDEAAKHAIVIYLLLDVMYAFSNKEGASVESFPTAFAIPIGLVKLIQGLWLLDHHDHQSAFELLLHPATAPCQFEWQHERILQALMCQGQHAEALRYLHVTKPPIASTSQAKLCLSVLLHNRCLIEAWSLIRQHSNRLNISELLGFLYESCQEQGLMKELLKLPLGLSEQDGLEKFLQGTGGLQNRELLMVHYLQQANYIPALQLNQTLKMNLMNERDPKLKEQSNTRNSILDQYGKVLPTVQRKLATERAKPYQHPHTIHKEVSRPQPLSTITKRSAGEKVISRAGFINNILTKIGEVWLGKGVSPTCSPAKSPRAAHLKSQSLAPSSALPEPFLGTPITMSSKRKSRLMNLVVQPSCPQPMLSPPRLASSWLSPKSVCKAPELSLLQTPQVVKRARALAASGPVFSAFTPQSILRSSLRPTPVATPSASPGRSVTPPLRKENRITFIEEAESPELEKRIHWTNGEAAENEISLLAQGALLSKATHKSWSSHEEDHFLRDKEQQSDIEMLPPKAVSNLLSIHTDSETKPHLISSFETSATSLRSADTTLEFYDAPLSMEEEKDQDEDDGIVIIKALGEKEGTPQSTAASDQVEPEAEVLEKEELPQEQNKDEDKDIEEEETKQLPQERSEGEAVEVEEEEEKELPQEQRKEEKELPQEQHEDEDKEEEKELPLEQHKDEANKEQEEKDLPEPETEALSTELPEEQELPLEEKEEEIITEGENVRLEDIPEKTPALESAKEEGDVQTEHLMDENILIKVCTEYEAAVTSSEQEASSYGCSEVMEGSNAQAEEVCEQLSVQTEDSSASKTAVETVAVEASEETLEPEPTVEVEPEVDQSTDLTEFVQKHLFGDDLSSPLTRSGIHSHSETSISESLDKTEEEKVTIASAPAFASQKSITSITSSEPTGTDSHSVVSLNDSEEPSRPVSEDEEEGSDEEEEEESDEEEGDEEEEEGEEGDDDDKEEDEDSGSEVEIIEEIEGRPQPAESAEFEPQGQSNFLPIFSEHEAEAFSPDVKTEEEAVGEVLMVQVGTDEEMDEEHQGASYVELKQSTTLVVPLELVEGHNTLMNAADQEPNEVFQSLVPDDLKTESQCSFSLTLDLEEDGDKEPQPIESDLPPPGIPPLEIKESPEEPLIIPDVEVMESDQTDFPDTEIPEDDEKEIEGPQIDAPVESIKDNPAEEKVSDDIPKDQMTENTIKEAQLVKDEQSTSEETKIQNNEQFFEIPEPENELSNMCDKKEILNTAVTDADEEETKNFEKSSEFEVKPNTEDEVAEAAQEYSQRAICAAKDREEEMESSEEKKEMVEEHKNTSKRRNNIKKEEPVIAQINTEPENPAVLETPGTGRKSRAPYTLTRRTTRANRTVTFVSPVTEEAVEEKNEPEVKEADEHEAVKVFISSPGRLTRRSKAANESNISTPRRSTRRTRSEPQSEPESVLESKQEEIDMVEIVSDNTVSSTTSKLSSGRKRASQRASKRSSSEEVEASSESEFTQEAADSDVGTKSSTQRKAPTKRKAAQSTTPRRSSRRTANNNEDAPQPLEILEEVEEQQEVNAAPEKQISNKSKDEQKLPIPTVEENNRNNLAHSPLRRTRQSSRGTLNLYPQVQLEHVSLPQSLRKRGKKHQDQAEKHLDQPMEEQTLLDPPLEVDTETPVVDALIKRLQDEDIQDVSKSVTRSSKSRTKSVVEPEPPVENILPFDPDKSSPAESSFIYSPSRRRAAAKRAESPQQSHTAPVTRSRRKVSTADAVAPENETAVEERAEEPEASNTRKKSRKPTKSKAVLEPALVAEVDLLSPMPSPIEPVPRAQKRTKEAEGPTSTMNLRRKRIMDTVLNKPVTRRKKL